jgi:hypothetical protein
MPRLYIFMLFTVFFSIQHTCLGLADKIGAVFNSSSGSWLKSLTLKSAQDMNWQDNPEHPQDAGGNSAMLAIVFCNDDKLKEVFTKMTGADFFKQMAELKNKYATSIYIAETEIVPSDTKEFSVAPKDNDLSGQKIYNDTKFIVGYVSYQTPGDHWIEIPKDDIHAALRFDKDMMVLEPKTTTK